MNRSRWTVLTLALVAGVVALLYGLDGTSATKGPDLSPLRAQAALAPCPAGLGAALPKLTLSCLGGGSGTALQASGTGVPTLVNVYGSWCGPCQKEMPILAAFVAKAGGKVNVVGVDTEDDTSNALHFAIDMKQHWPAIVDDDKRVLISTHLQGPPATLFLDASGKQVHLESGAFSSLAELEALVRKHFGITL